MDTDDVICYIKENYKTSPIYMWKKFPNYAVFKKDSNKWFALLMDVEEEKLGISANNKNLRYVLNVKCEPDLVNYYIQQDGFLPAYHMNKRNWVTILLDQVSEKNVKDLIEESYFLVK